MKPTLPEDRELEETGSKVSERYRAGAQDEPPTKLDAAILDAARREVEQSRPRRNWQMPASIAAMLVIGVSLVLIVRDNEPPLPSLDRPAADEAKLAKSAPAQLAMKTSPVPRADFHREDRSSRERSVRPDREPVTRGEVAAVQGNAASGATVQPAPAPAPAAPAIAEPLGPAEQEQARIAESRDLSSSKKSATVADAAPETGASVRALRKQETAAPAQPREWLEEIDGLLRDGKQTEARRRLLDFRQQYPHYPLPDRLQALLPPEAAK